MTDTTTTTITAAIAAPAQSALDALPEPFRALALKWRPVVDRAGRLSAAQWRMYAEFVADLAAASEEYYEACRRPAKVCDRTHRGSGV
jgi:hypothetical protein